ncbi:MAG: PAS sensor protein [Sphingopyxis sp.]|nr:PAS sensor protein [Sphingopyxis sp.]
MKAAQEPQRVSAAEFIRGFANWRLQAARKPVVVTHHGKDAHVLISLDDYRRLDGERSDSVTADVLGDSQAGVIEAIRDGVILIDRHWRIAAINPAASDLVEIAAAQLVGAELTAAIPGLKDGLLFHHIIRMLDHRERFAGEIPGVLRPRQWLRVDLVPLPVGGAIILRDVSEAMEGFAESDMRAAMMATIEAQGDIGHARLSLRETVEDANGALTAMIGVDPVAIRRVRFSALLSIGSRQAFAEALDSVFRTGVPASIAADLVTREGVTIAATLAIAELRGAYACDGAFVLITPRRGS